MRHIYGGIWMLVLNFKLIVDFENKNFNFTSSTYGDQIH